MARRKRERTDRSPSREESTEQGRSKIQKPTPKQSQEDFAHPAGFVLDVRPSTTPLELEDVPVVLPDTPKLTTPKPESAGRQGLRGRYFMAPDSSKRCFNCGGNGHNARECMEPKKTSICFLCAQSGHESRDCPNELCYNCDAPGHMARDCREPRRPRVSCRVCFESGHLTNECDKYVFRELLGKKLRGPQFCYRCGQQGHLGIECDRVLDTPNVEPSPRLNGGTCFLCGGTGHIKRDCPNQSPWQGRGKGGLFGSSPRSGKGKGKGGGRERVVSVNHDRSDRWSGKPRYDDDVDYNRRRDRHRDHQSDRRDRKESKHRRTRSEGWYDTKPPRGRR